MDHIHTCSYECQRPPCIKAQRDELWQKVQQLTAEREEITRRLNALAGRVRETNFLRELGTLGQESGNG